MNATIHIIWNTNLKWRYNFNRCYITVNRVHKLHVRLTLNYKTKQIQHSFLYLFKKKKQIEKKTLLSLIHFPAHTVHPICFSNTICHLYVCVIFIHAFFSCACFFALLVGVSTTKNKIFFLSFSLSLYLSLFVNFHLFAPLIGWPESIASWHRLLSEIVILLQYSAKDRMLLLPIFFSFFWFCLFNHELIFIFWRERERNRECAYVCVWMWPICVSHTHSLSLNYMNCVEICMENLWILHVIRRIELNNKSRLDLYFSFFWFSDFFFVNFFCVTSVFRLYLDIVYFCHSSKLTFG